MNKNPGCLAIALLLVSIFGLAIVAAQVFLGNYHYRKVVLAYWELADKCSTISKKKEYIDQFVLALEAAKLDGEHDAIFLTTPDNSFDRNFDALHSLQLRLHEIEKMDVASFQYQTAIQQITQQEQGEAQRDANGV